MSSSVDTRTQAGFSLVEMMVSMGIMLIVTASVLTLTKDAFRISFTAYELTDAQESVRTAHEYISRDLLTAGDGMKNINNICLRENFVSNYLTKNPANNPCGGGLVNLPIIHSDNNVPTGTTVLGIAPTVSVRSTPTATDRLTLLQLDSTFTPVTPTAVTPSGANISVAASDLSKFAPGEIYFILSSIGATFGTVTNKAGGNIIFAASDALGLNAPGNGGPINLVSAGGTLPISIRRMRIINYFVDQNGVLTRRTFGTSGGVGYSDSVITDHITNLQIRYVLGADEDGNNQQPVAQLTVDQQEAVRQVEVSVTAETVHPVNKGKTQPVVMTTTTSVRNLQFLEALQP